MRKRDIGEAIVLAEAGLGPYIMGRRDRDRLRPANSCSSSARQSRGRFSSA